MMNWLRAMPEWLAQEGALILVSVADAEGSTPREAGASMLVSGSATCDTIGGGHLEWEAIAIARALLQKGNRTHLMRFALGPRLGQCCGGVAWLLFERIEPESALLWRGRAEAVARGARLLREATSKGSGSEWSIAPADDDTQPRFRQEGENWQLRQALGQEPFPVVIFGGGHVGEALVATLAPVGAQVTWIDTRDDVLPEDPPLHVRCIVTDTPESEVVAAPAGSHFVVLTHSHALDLELCAQILCRTDFAWFGLIGSRTKRARFEQRLLARGFEPARLAEMTCPIGVPGIHGKEPAVIAIAVVAQLLQVREARGVLRRAADAGTLAPARSISREPDTHRP